MLYNIDQILQMGQDSAAHQNRDLLHNLDASVACLPRFATLADGSKEGEEGGQCSIRYHRASGEE